MYVRGRNGAKSRSQFPIGCTTIIFRVHIDSMYDIMSSTTWCVGNEQQFVELTTVWHDIYLQSSDKTETQICEARFEIRQKNGVLALSSLPRKRVNGFVSSTIFWVFFRSLVDFEGHCIDKIHTILIWSRSFFSTIRSKIRNRIDRNLYPTVLDDVI